MGQYFKWINVEKKNTYVHMTSIWGVKGWNHHIRVIRYYAH